MKKLMIATLLLLFFYLLSCKKDAVPESLDVSLEQALAAKSHTGSADWYVLPSSTDYQALPNQDPKNPVTPQKVALGKMLFFETGIGMAAKQDVSMGTYSCSTCHVPEKNFTANRFQGIADGGVGFGLLGEGRMKNPSYDGTEVDAQGARPLPVINLSYVRNALWNGSFGSFGLNVATSKVWGVADSLTKINFEGREGLEAAITRALVVHRQVINKDLMDKLGYTQSFDSAFPDVAQGERYTFQNASHAIAAYFRTIFTNEAPFQKWLKGNVEAMTNAQKRGAILFLGKAGCVNCHNSPSFNSQDFAAVGVKNLDQNGYLAFKTNDGRNKGRGGFTLNDNDLHKFKVPQLYNLKGNGFYFHGASKHTIREVVEYFNLAIPENSTVPASRLDTRFKPLYLTKAELDDLTDFVENGLYDANLIRYKPGFVMSGNCFPNNDPQSKIDMGCK